jgi:hypothetical protein
MLEERAFFEFQLDSVHIDNNYKVWFAEKVFSEYVDVRLNFINLVLNTEKYNSDNNTIKIAIRNINGINRCIAILRKNNANIGCVCPIEECPFVRLPENILFLSITDGDNNVLDLNLFVNTFIRLELKKYIVAATYGKDYLRLK